MRERHNWATGKHPKTCTCATCQKRRVEAAMPRQKKKRKPKSQRGKGKAGDKKSDSSSALAEALDIFGFSASETSVEPTVQADSGDPESDRKKGETQDEPEL